MNETHRKTGAALLAAALAAALAAPPARAQLGDLLRELDLPAAAPSASALSESDVVAGLKEALARGTERAVASLGRRDGFLGDPKVRIPVPERLRGVAKTLRALGQGRYVDDLVETMNRAAEQAVPEAAGIFADAIRQMSFADARRILDGPDDAATRYLRQVGEERLAARFRPVVEEATGRAGATRAYKSLAEQAGPVAGMLGMGEALDLDGYVTAKALDGLFAGIAAEERRIRHDPVARGSELLRKVFGAAR